MNIHCRYHNMFDIDVNDGPLATNKIQMQILFVSSSISACFACKFYCLQVEIIKIAIYIRSTHTNCMIRLILDIQDDDSITPLRQVQYDYSGVSF